MIFLSKFLTISENILIYIVCYFAIFHHLKTFFSPFKRVAIKDDSPGVNLQVLGEVISYNLVSIVIGMIIRTTVIVLGLLVLLTVSLLLLLILFFLTILSPLWVPAYKAAEIADKQDLQNLVAQAKTAPGEVLRKIMLTKSLGKFVRAKIVIDDAQLVATTSTPSDYSDAKEVSSLSDLVISLAKNFDPFKQLLQKNLLDEQDVERICLWYQNLKQKGLVNLLDRETITKVSGIGADWSFGYTNQLNKYQVSQSSSPFPRVVGRDKEVETVEKILSKTNQNSVIVAGEPGVGRHAVVDEFSRRLYDGSVLPDLVGRRTIYLDLKSAMAGQPDLATSRKFILDLFEEARYAGNVIIVIDDIDKFLETGGERLDLTDILNQTLSEGKLRIVGITSKQLADKYIFQNSSLLKLFAVCVVDAPDIETVYLEMELSICPVLEKENKVDISYTAIKESIVNADRFISSVPFPEKSINILDEAVSYIKSEHPHMKSLWGADVQKYLSEKTQIPISSLSGNQKERLADLEGQLHQRIVGQDEAVSAVSRAMRRAVLSVSARNKPIGTFLFLGPTGVGKTETAKALAQVYFGAENRLVRFDMSEYQGETGIERLLGSPERNTPGQLTSAIVNNPFAVILFDEIEKTPPIISNLFLTLLDEGYLTDNFNRKVSARQNIIIGTSNAGALFIKDRVESGQNLETLSPDLLKHVQDEKIFSPEFLNRFDAAIVFRPLDSSQIKEVVKKMLGAVAKRVAEKKITLEFSDAILDRIVAEGYDPSFGARSVRRYIQDVVEDEISQKLLSGDFPPGSTLKV